MYVICLLGGYNITQVYEAPPTFRQKGTAQQGTCMFPYKFREMLLKGVL